MTPRTITVSLDMLIKHIIDNCPNLTFTFEGTEFCRRKMKASCRIPFHERDNCPDDCPHLHETTSWRCDGEKCSYVRKIIKTLKA